MSMVPRHRQNASAAVLSSPIAAVRSRLCCQFGHKFEAGYRLAAMRALALSSSRTKIHSVTRGTVCFAASIERRLESLQIVESLVLLLNHRVHTVDASLKNDQIYRCRHQTALLKSRNQIDGLAEFEGDIENADPVENAFADEHCA